MINHPPQEKVMTKKKPETKSSSSTTSQVKRYGPYSRQSYDENTDSSIIDPLQHNSCARFNQEIFHFNSSK
jgi:hypothetical protein